MKPASVYLSSFPVINIGLNPYFSSYLVSQYMYSFFIAFFAFLGLHLLHIVRQSCIHNLRSHCIRTMNTVTLIVGPNDKTAQALMTTPLDWETLTMGEAGGVNFT
jgi:hypothetical protein